MRTARHIRGLAVLAMAATIAGGAFASAAIAAQGGTSESGSGGRAVEAEPRFQLVGAHGCRVLISARQRTVTIGVSRPGNTSHSGSSTTYVARGSGGRNGIHANFRQFGRVDVRFHRTAAAAQGLPSDCFGGTTGAATITGYFTGTIEFEGEGGYTSVHAHRVKGEVVLPPTEQCPLVAGGVNPLIEDPNAELPQSKTRMSLEAIDKAGTGGLIFYARRAGKTGFYAEDFGTRGRIGILSVAYALGPRSSFASDPQVSFGKVTPPKPFLGSATLRRGSGGKRSWTGTLAAEFPGQGTVSLVGTEFRTTLARSFP